MKKILFTIMIMVFGLGMTNAQTSQGNLFFGGGISFENSKEETGGEDETTSRFTFGPSVGFFVIDNLALGLDFAVSNTKTDDGAGGDDKNFGLAVGPFARYYKFTSNEKFAFVGEFGVGFGFNKFKPDGGDETKGSFFNMHLSPGFAYFFNEHWALDLELQGILFQSQDPDKDEEDDKSTYFRFGASSFNPTLGIRYFLK